MSQGKPREKKPLPPHAIKAVFFVSLLGGEESAAHRFFSEAIRVRITGPGRLPQLDVIENDITAALRIEAVLKSDKAAEAELIQAAALLEPDGIGCVVACALYNRMYKARLSAFLKAAAKKRESKKEALKQQNSEVGKTSTAAPVATVQVVTQPPRSRPVPALLLNMIAMSTGKTIRMTPSTLEIAKTEACAILSALDAPESYRNDVARVILMRAGEGKKGALRDASVVKTARAVAMEVVV